MHATLGQRALDMGRATEAVQHFQQAVAADPTSAFAQLGAANASTSFADYDAKLAAAAKLAPNASRAEQLQIGIAQKTLISDFAGAEGLAKGLIAAAADNPRSYLALATVQQQEGKEAEARVTMKKAIAVAPNFSPSYLQLAYSYLTNQPTDPAKAKPYIDKLVVLEPKEARVFIAQGSYFRAMNQLPSARRSYSRAAALDSTQAMALGQRGHVESFLGNYDAARADYDAALKHGKQNEPGTYAMYRALVAAHAGNPKQSIAELDQLVKDIDGMNLPDPVGAKIGALTSEVQIAIQSGDFESASRAIAQRTPLVREQVAQATDEKVKRLVEADIAYYDGLLAARQSDATTAKTKADDIMRIVAETSDPQKDQPAHAILGVLALEQKDYPAAVMHLEQANPNDIYILYERALALDGAGRKAEAKVLYRKIARFNFNGAGVALSRADAAKRSK
jgi:tetratricopeptide (TPR) repeat protein